jgi:hypothetical protein
MSVVGLVVLVVLLVFVGFMVLRPLFAPLAPSQTQLLNRQRERALAYYERVLTNVRDLDDDFATQKINPDEYAQEREVWVERGVKILQLFDELDAQTPLSNNPQADDAEIDQLIEARIQALRQTESEVR